MDPSVVFSLVVPGPEPDYEDTGLVTPEGDPIYRPSREPMGFLWGLFEEGLEEGV